MRATAADPPGPSDLEVLAGDPPALVVALLAGHGAQDTGVELAVVGGQVDLTGNAGHVPDAGPGALIEKILELPRPAVEPVEVVDDHPVHPARC